MAGDLDPIGPLRPAIPPPKGKEDRRRQRKEGENPSDKDRERRRRNPDGSTNQVDDYA